MGILRDVCIVKSILSSKVQLYEYIWYHENGFLCLAQKLHIQN